MTSITEIKRLIGSGLRTLLLTVSLSTTLTGCFTGVESTPKITYKDVKREKVTVSPEQEMAKEFTLPPYSDWHPGKKFYVTSPKISLALTSAAGGEINLSTGDVLTYMGAHNATSLTGTQVVELTLQTPDGQNVLYRTNATEEQLKERETLEIPFAIDIDYIEAVAGKLLGKKFYTRTALWYTPDGEVAGGRKFVEVQIIGIKPANETYPVMIIFNDMTGHSGAVYMSASSSVSGASRKFDSLFFLTDPREKYPRITNENWSLIQQSKVKEGMTRDEAMLALGAPSNVDRGRDYSFAYERWSYPDGRYLIFEDGILVRFNR